MSEYDPYSPAEDEIDEDRKVRAENELKGEIGDITWLMNNKRGRRIVRRLLDQAGVYQQSYTGEALSTAFNEGRRSRGLKLIALVTTQCPDQYALLLKERSDNVD